MLTLVQIFDPPGVTVRSPHECLLIQLQQVPNPDPASIEIIEKHFEALSQRRYSETARALKLPLDRMLESVEAIMSLEPKPGHRFGANDSRCIVPDVFVYKMRGEYTIPCG